MTQEEIFRSKSLHYLHCFVNDCPRHEQCLHWLVSQHTQRTNINITSVNPMNPGVKEGHCEMFRENKTVTYAFGLKSIYHDMTYDQVRAIKARLINIFSRKTYYEYHNGARPISPQAQAKIEEVCRSAGYTGEIRYGKWQEDYLW